MHINSCSRKEPANNLHHQNITITTLPLPCDKTLQPFHSENMVFLVKLMIGHINPSPPILWAYKPELGLVFHFHQHEQIFSSSAMDCAEYQIF